MTVARQRDRGKLVASLSIRDMPEALADMRRDLARLIRTRAESDWRSGEQNIIDMSVRRALNEIADAFEAGLAQTDEVETAGRREGVDGV